MRAAIKRTLIPPRVAMINRQTRKSARRGLERRMELRANPGEPNADWKAALAIGKDMPDSLATL
jgi:hypothetical protein